MDIDGESEKKRERCKSKSLAACEVCTHYGMFWS